MDLAILILSLVTACQTLLTMWLLSNKNRWGWISSLVSQPVWGAFNFLSGGYGGFILTVALTILAIRGWRRWNDNK